MRSPFPGMDPYLESRWGDVRTALCVEIRAALQPGLPVGLRARAQQSDPSATGGFVPRDRWVQIIDTTAESRVVTAIEILDPRRKLAGPPNRHYRQKLLRYVEAGVNVVEIDLLRSSRERLAVRTEELPQDRRAAYLTCVRRAIKPLQWEVYPMPLRSPLPTVPVPCRETEPDVPLALQPLIDRIYVEGGHDDIDYRRPPDPPWDTGDAEWANDLIRQFFDSDRR